MENYFAKIACDPDVKEFEEILNYHQWRHRIPIREGFVTPGYLSDDYWRLSHFPSDLSGKSVLDIGANDGINAFHAERIGAREVVGIDLYQDREELLHTVGWTHKGCELAKLALGSKVDFIPLSAYDVKSLNKTFDVVLMADVMNWLPDIYTLISAVSSVCGETLIIRDGLMRKKEHLPFLEYVHSPTYDLMYLPNAKFMEVILKQNGFKTVEFRKINVDLLFEDWVMNFPLVTADKEIPVFQNPWSDVVIKKLKPTQEQVLSRIGPRIMLRGSGWINIVDAKAETFQPRAIFSLARKLFGDTFVVKLKTLLNKQNDASYTIIAKR
jgi:tRNA (mo5U34)-methyltransferase